MHDDSDPRNDRTDEEDVPTPEDTPGEPGAEGGSKSPSSDKLPGTPSDDESEVGDTDQHSSA